MRRAVHPLLHRPTTLVADPGCREALRYPRDRLRLSVLAAALVVMVVVDPRRGHLLDASYPQGTTWTGVTVLSERKHYWSA